MKNRNARIALENAYETLLAAKPTIRQFPYERLQHELYVWKEQVDALDKIINHVSKMERMLEE